MTPAERREAEMEQGRKVVGAAGRLATLERFEEDGYLREIWPRHYEDPHPFISCGRVYIVGNSQMILHCNDERRDFPSEEFIATAYVLSQAVEPSLCCFASWKGILLPMIDPEVKDALWVKPNKDIKLGDPYSAYIMRSGYSEPVEFANQLEITLRTPKNYKHQIEMEHSHG